MGNDLIIFAVHDYRKYFCIFQNIELDFLCTHDANVLIHQNKLFIMSYRSNTNHQKKDLKDCQAFGRQSSGNCQTVIRQLSGSHLTIITGVRPKDSDH